MDRLIVSPWGRVRLLGLALLLMAAAAPAFAQSNSLNSGYFPGGAGIAAANGSVIQVLPSSALAGGVLTLPTTAVRAAQYELETPGSGPTTTAPYYLTTYAELPGTINYARVAMLAASGGNFQYVVHVVHAGTDTVVTGLNNNGVCNGESGCATAQLATYASPNVAAATAANTYAVGDQIYVSFNTVGGTFTNVSFHLSVTQ